MDAFCALAKKYGLFILEDACQADGGAYKGKRLGSIGSAGALSFNQFKIVTAGEGGALLTNDDTVYQRALIYHDASAIAFFGDQLKDVTEPQFCGTEFRTNEITAAILHRQFLKLDGILHDLRRNKALLADLLSIKYRFAPSNDAAGDCGTTLPVVFGSEAEARAFCVKATVGTIMPIDTGKHIYNHWTAILEKRGALHPLMDPFKFPANAPFVPDYAHEAYPVTLDLLARTAYLLIEPDWTEEQIRAAAKALLD